MKNHESIRSVDGLARIQYNPEWSESKPFCTFIRGTAGLQFSGLHLAVMYLTKKGYTFK